MARRRQHGACRQCGGSLPAPAQTGRPRIYCGDVCRRLAEYEIRRVQGHLARSERELQKARMLVARGVFGAEDRVGPWQAEVDRLTAEFRALLAALVDDKA